MDCIACQAPPSMGFSRQEYWSVLPCLPPRDLPNPGIEPASPDWQVDSLPLSHLEAPTHITGYKVEVPQVPQILLHETKSASKFLKDLNASLSFSDTETMDNK